MSEDYAGMIISRDYGPVSGDIHECLAYIFREVIFREVTQPRADDMTPRKFQEIVMPKFQCLMENLTANVSYDLEINIRWHS